MNTPSELWYRVAIIVTQLAALGYRAPPTSYMPSICGA